MCLCVCAECQNVCLCQQGTPHTTHTRMCVCVHIHHKHKRTSVHTSLGILCMWFFLFFTCKCTHISGYAIHVSRLHFVFQLGVCCCEVALGCCNAVSGLCMSCHAHECDMSQQERDKVSKGAGERERSHAPVREREQTREREWEWERALEWERGWEMQMERERASKRGI